MNSIVVSNWSNGEIMFVICDTILVRQKERVRPLSLRIAQYASKLACSLTILSGNQINHHHFKRNRFHYTSNSRHYNTTIKFDTVEIEPDFEIKENGSRKLLQVFSLLSATDNVNIKF